MRPALRAMARSGTILLVSILSPIAEVTSVGVFAPTPVPGSTRDVYFRNLDLAYDDQTDRLTLIRVTPYPYDATGTIPCFAGPCPVGLSAFPTRGQVYSKVVGSGDALSLLDGTWTLELDVGRSTGWNAPVNLVTCSPVAASYPQQMSIAVDLDSLNVHKSSTGRITREGDGTVAYYLGGFSNRQAICAAAETANDTFLFGALYSLLIDYPIYEDGFETGTAGRWDAVVTSGSDPNPDV